jgi:hypothetical protein
MFAGNLKFFSDSLEDIKTQEDYFRTAAPTPFD